MSFNLHLITNKVGEAQQMEAELRRELARVARDIEVIIMLVELRLGIPKRTSSNNLSSRHYSL